MFDGIVGNLFVDLLCNGHCGHVRGIAPDVDASMKL